MKAINIYLVLLALGILLPLYFFVPFIIQYGLDVNIFFQQLFSSNIGGFFGMDVFVSGAVTIYFILAESRRLDIRYGPWCLLGLVIGVSVALPLFLYIRQRSLDALPQKGVVTQI